MIEVILKDNRGGDGVDLAALAQAACVAALSAHDGLRFLRRLALVPQLHRHADNTRRESGEVLGAACLRTDRAVGVQRQPNDHLSHAFTASQIGQRIQDRRQPAPTIEHEERAGQQAQLVAQRHADASFASVNAEDATLVHCRATSAPRR
jgi:hypothetical protein